jgi:hypothetical protein
MKKWFIGLSLALAAATAAIYFFIPANIKIRKILTIRANEKGVNRFLQQKEGIVKWWPGGDTALQFNNGNYTITKPLYQGIAMNIVKNGTATNSELNMVALNIDSIQIVWSATVPGGADPISRISNYNKAATIKKDMEAILLHLKVFMERMENIYDIKVERTKIKDTLLLTTTSVTKGMPDNTTIYGMVRQLEQYILAGGSTATNVPMLHTFTEDSSSFKTMVAIPINKELPETNTISIKRMVPGNVLITEIKGGPATIRHSLHQLDVYRNNYNYTAPAKPFQSLITNRLLETDTAKWVTKIYWPIF